MKLTTATVKALALPAGVTDKIFFDDELPRFGVRVRAGGSRTWVVQYGIGGKERKLPLGPVSALDPGKARSLAKDVLARVRLGEDPLALKHEAVARARETFGAHLPRYLAFKRASLRPRSYAQVERHLTVHARPLHNRPLASLASDRRAVTALLGKIAEGSGPVEANMVRSSLSACCTWLLREGLLDANPIVATNKAPQARARMRVLTDAELKAIWNALDDDRYGAIVKLLALTALRREEVGGLRWSEVDFDRKSFACRRSVARTSDRMMCRSRPSRSLGCARDRARARQFSLRSDRGRAARPASTASSPAPSCHGRCTTYAGQLALSCTTGSTSRRMWSRLYLGTMAGTALASPALTTTPPMPIKSGSRSTNGPIY